MFTLEKIEPLVPEKELTGFIGVFGGMLSDWFSVVDIMKWVYRESKMPDKSPLKKRIEIDNETITVIQEGKPNIFYLISDINALQIHNNTDQFNKANQYLKYPKIAFTYKEEAVELYYKEKEYNLLKICDYFYKNNIPFKEYRNEVRVFMGKRQSYKAVQELKTKYKMDW